MLTQQQLKERQAGIGGSDAGAVMRLNKYRTQLDVYYDKTSDITDEDTLAQNRFIHWGNLLEDLVAEEYQRVSGNKVRRKNTMVAHKEIPYMLANVDRIVEKSDRLLECKTASQYVAGQWGEEYTDQVPDSYLIQCQHYMSVLDRSVCDLAVLIGGNDFRIYTIERNEDLEKAIIEVQREFWIEHVQKGVAPAPYTLDELDAVFRVDDGSAIQADQETFDTVMQYKDCQLLIKNAEKEKKELQTVLKRKMGEAKAFIDPAGNKLATWASHDRSGIDGKLLKEQYPEIAEAVTAVTTVRPFRTY